MLMCESDEYQLVLLAKSGLAKLAVKQFNAL